MIYFKLVSYSCNFIRKYSGKVKPVVVTDENVLNKINNNVFKPRKHPGVVTPKTVTLPDEFVKAVVSVTEDTDYPVKTLIAQSEKLTRHLKGRLPPWEKEELQKKIEEIQAKVISRYKNVVIENEEDERKFKQKVENKVQNVIKDRLYNWKPVKYNVYNSLVYLMGRSAPEYAVLLKIFGEISARDPDFKPKSFFDFGSGIGTATWAANHYWKEHIFEYFNVDSSPDMNDLALILLQGGKGSGQLPKGTFYRQFLPATGMTYDLVICAYSLLELFSSQSRLQTILNLWNKTEQYLVIVEQGTNAGFKVVNEVRDFILQKSNDSNIGHVFSPCPHDNTCPRFLLDDGTPCNFEVRFFTLPVGQNSDCKTELYTYVVLKKGRREENVEEWPRIVRPTLVRPRHSICRVCTAQGKLGEVIFTASKHGKVTYHCARASKWGDRLPLTLDFEVVNKLNNKVVNDDCIDSEESVCETVSSSLDDTVDRDSETTNENVEYSTKPSGEKT